MQWFLGFFLLVLVACSAKVKPEDILHLPEAASPAYDQFFFSSVKPLLDKRCVSCHACYTAPCQLNLAHMEGIRRGATKVSLYDGARLQSIQPTRLFIDAHSALEWMQKKDFFPVARRNINDLSLFEALITQRTAYPGPVKRSVKESQDCPATPKELGSYQESHAEGGMPYGFPALAPAEQLIIARWLQNGYPKLTAERERALGQSRQPAALLRWEKLWNQPDARHKLVARYIYEHLYIGHLQLPELPGEFFRMVRSRTPAPQPIDIIATTWPFDSPGAGPFYYRLQKVEETITLKNHILYPLSNDQWNRWQQLFFAADWSLEDRELPSYQTETAANPFLAFQAIPAASRYRFLLDQSLFFVSAFIKGPVCEGPTAVNVIDEHFFIFFLAPRQDLTQQNPGYLEQMAKDLVLPAKGKNDPLSSLYVQYKAAQIDFVDQRRKLFAESFPRGLQLSDIWDGEGTNPQAALTVMRHFDNASVTIGVHGQLPKTLWVMDYPIFERMYYLLVAGFDVFGNVFHQSATRMYMDNLRVESEDLFLSFLPATHREALRASWYRGFAAEELMKYLNPYGGVLASSQISYRTPDPKREFVSAVLKQRFNARVRGPADFFPGPDEILQQLSQRTGANFAPLPDLSFLLVEGAAGKDRLYSLVHHKEHLNVSFMFGEDGRRVPAEDRIDIVPGVYGAFPNFFLKVPEEKLFAFVQDTLQLEEKKNEKMQAWIQHYGLSRQNPEFWTEFDRIQSLVDRLRGEASGVLDLSKYELW